MASDPTSAFPSAASSVEPSKVLHLRNLPEECTELDLRTISEKCSHGEVVRVLLLSRKHQGFVEFKSFEDSARMLANCISSPIRLGSRLLIAQYSNKPEIATPQRDSAVDGSNGGLGNLNGDAGGNSILLVTVTNVVYPVNVDCLYKVFRMQGNVLKIVTFTKQVCSRSLLPL
jgi:polypyrimidine tract-binding protein 2